MKFRPFISNIIIAFLFCFSTHRYYEFVVPKSKPTVSVNIKALYAKDDVFQLYYTTDLDEGFSEKKSKTFAVQGGVKDQTIKFKLPPFTKLRLDYSNNKEQFPVAIKSIKIAEYEKVFEIHPSQFSSFLTPNKQTTLDSLNIFHPHILKNVYDPFLTLNKSPIKFLVVHKPSVIVFSTFEILLFCLFLFACFSFYPLTEIFFKIKTINEVNRFQWFLITLTILFIKGFTKIYFSDIWAEDGVIFLKESFQMGFAAIFNSYAGYYHTLPRLLAQLFSYFPALFIPFLITISCYLIYAFVLVEVLRKEYNWIIKDQWVKLILIFLWCLNPAIDEVVGNLANLHWILLAFLGILSLRDLESNYSILDLVMIFLCISTEGTVLIFLPVFALRIILKFIQTKKLKTSKEEFMILGLIVFFTILNFTIRENRVSTSLSIVQLEVWCRNFATNFISAPIFGDHFTLVLMRSFALVVICNIVFTVAFGIFIFKYWDRKNILILMLLGNVIILPVMISMARPSSVEILTTFYNFNEVWWNCRYAFFLPFFGSLCFVWIVSKQSDTRVKRIILAWLLIVSLFLNHRRIFNTPLGFDRIWIKNADRIDDIRTGKLQEKISVPIYPSRWKVEINPPSRN